MAIFLVMLHIAKHVLVKKKLSSKSLVLAQMPLLCLDLSINISMQFFN